MNSSALTRARPALVAALCAAAGVPALLAPAGAQAAFGDHPLRRGSHGHDVRVLQRWLTLVGVRTSVDGEFGRRTVASVRRYERRFDLRVDGRVSRGQAHGLRKRAYAAHAAQAQAPSRAAQPQPATTPGDRAVLSADGRTALVPESAPPQVAAAIRAANEITDRPYRYGGGHGSFRDSAYDCSGAVSYALHGAGLLDEPEDSSQLERFGRSGAGRWISVYANSGHAYVVIAGLRFDTSGSGEDGPRWRPQERSGRGYVVRHPAGL